jgi:hypothetical protein
MSMANQLIPEVLRCLLQHDQETGRWNGHCLDLDLATSGETSEVAWKNLRAVVRLHIEHCFTNWQEGLKFCASDSEIAVFEALKAKQPVRSEIIQLNLVPPKDRRPSMPALWIQAVEDKEGLLNVSTRAALQ